MSEESGKTESLVWKFAKLAGKAIVLGTLSFAFGVAVGGLVDFHVWHDIAELKPVIEQTSWIKDLFRAETIFGGSIVDGLVALGDVLGTTPELPGVEEARQQLAQAVPQNSKPDW